MSPWCNRTQAPDRATRRVRKPTDRLQRRRGGGDAPDGDGPDTGKRSPASGDSPSWGPDRNTRHSLSHIPSTLRCSVVSIVKHSFAGLAKSSGTGFAICVETLNCPADS